MRGLESLNNAVKDYFSKIQKENPFQTLKFKLGYDKEVNEDYWDYEKDDWLSKDPSEHKWWFNINKEKPGVCVDPSLQIVQKRHACEYLYNLLNGNDKYQLFCLYYLIDDENIKQQAKEVLGENFPEIKVYLDWMQRNITFNYESLFIWGELSLELPKEFAIKNADVFSKKNLENTRWCLPCLSLNHDFKNEIFISNFDEAFKKASQAYPEEQALIKKHNAYVNNTNNFKNNMIIDFMTTNIESEQKKLLKELNSTCYFFKPNTKRLIYLIKLLDFLKDKEKMQQDKLFYIYFYLKNDRSIFNIADDFRFKWYLHDYNFYIQRKISSVPKETLASFKKYVADQFSDPTIIFSKEFEQIVLADQSKTLKSVTDFQSQNESIVVHGVLIEEIKASLNQYKKDRGGNESFRFTNVFRTMFLNHALTEEKIKKIVNPLLDSLNSKNVDIRNLEAQFLECQKQHETVKESHRNFQKNTKLDVVLAAAIRKLESENQDYNMCVMN